MAELTLFQTVVFLGCAGISATLLIKALYQVYARQMPQNNCPPLEWHQPD